MIADPWLTWYPILFTVAVAVFIAACGAAWVVFWWAERRQDAYRARLAAHPMHAHDGRPCYDPACAPNQED